MRIDLNFNNIEQLYGGTARRAGESTRESKPSQDTAELSLARSKVSLLTASAMAGSEIRSERLAELRSAIDEGTYQVEPRAIADAILKDLF